MKLFLNPRLLRRQPLSGACRPRTLFGPGAVAASVSKRNLADASGTALKLCKQSLIILPPVAPRQPPGACRPLSSFGSGAVAASVSLGNLADASGTALKRLIRLD